MLIFISADVQSPVNLRQLSLMIGLICETNSRVSLWKLLLFLFEQRTSRHRAQGTAKSNIHRQSGYALMHMGEEEQTGDRFSAQKNPTVHAGFEPGTSRSPVLSLTSRPPSPHIYVMHDFEYQNAFSIFNFRHPDALCCRNQSNVFSPSVARVAARSKAVILLLFSYCLILVIDMQST